MSTVTAVLLLVALLAALVAAGVLLRARTGADGGRRSLERRFGPEYDRTLEQHGGDRESAHRDLRERVERYGRLRPLPLEAAVREHYAGRWATLQERFVDAPGQALADADELLTRIAATRGFPEPERREEQLAALSVHHPHQVGGLRALRHAARTQAASTEEMRTALLGARALFEELTAAASPVAGRPASGRHRAPHLLKPKGSGA
ncbi:hypothetical protein [Streptomyces sp.]|uniref:hypothetical protein n=1 Tax=Streptomyces sp. TaxID=1931 RepID=UPI0028125D43|nr:hypothetical protein [Streptomyces sp.]